MYVPAAQALLTCAHAAPSTALENVDPSSHAAHRMSAVAEPAVDMPWPIGHVAHATHASLPALALKVPGWHVAQTRSDDALGAAVSYVPAAHTVMELHVRSATPVGGADV